MKALLLLSAILILVRPGFTQPSLRIDSTTGKITYSKVVRLDSTIKQAELYTRAREWFAKTYNSSQKVIQMDDKETGQIIGKALFTVTHRAMGANYPSGTIHYTITVAAKDGRYRYEITNFYHEREPGSQQVSHGDCENFLTPKNKLYKKVYDGYLEQMDKDMSSLLVSLTAAMNQKATGKKDDW